MDITATLHTDVDAAVLFGVVADLGGYPRWLDIVGRAVEAPADAGDPGPAWSVDLRGQLGPLRRSKRLRMVRTVADEPRHVRFERRELDGKQHSAWILEATIDPGDGADADASTALAMRLHYGGSLWVPMLDRVLRDEIVRSRPRLVAEAQRAG